MSAMMVSASSCSVKSQFGFEWSLNRRTQGGVGVWFVGSLGHRVCLWCIVQHVEGLWLAWTGMLMDNPKPNTDSMSCSKVLQSVQLRSG